MGPSGSEKELVARAIHSYSRRSKSPFTPVNCGALPEHILENELFGHERGAFTGADSTAQGLFEATKGGTTFLDEITETSLAFQVKLLRVLQEGEVRRLGSNKNINVNVRVIAATNKPLGPLMQAGAFREDLYYRLGVVTIPIPSLADRLEDIPLLAQQFLRKANQRNLRNTFLTSDALRMLGTISDTIRLYWDLVSLQQDLQVKEQSLEAAERLYRDTKNEVEQGTQAPVDLTSAMAQVASNRQAYINEQGMVLQQELLLKEVLTRKGISEPPLAAASIEAITPIGPPDSDTIEPLGTLIDEAKRERPDLALAEKQEEDIRLSLKGSRNALLPELNLAASMQNNGGVGRSITAVPIPGEASVVPPPDLLGGYSSMLGQIFKRDFPDYSVGAQLNMPIRNRIAKADVVRDELQYRQSEVRVYIARFVSRLVMPLSRSSKPERVIRPPSKHACCKNRRSIWSAPNLKQVSPLHMSIFNIKAASRKRSLPQ